MKKTKEEYYTPEIEEFHPGFEYEKLMHAPNWTKLIKPPKDLYEWVKANSFTTEGAMKGVKNEKYRVKYLDKDDVMDLGMSLTEEKPSPFTGFPLYLFHTNHEDGFNTGTDYYLEMLDSNLVQLTISTYGSYDTFENTMLFKIKNKSELKDLLTKVGYPFK